MGHSVLERYLLRESAGAWAAVTFVLMAVMLATRFSRFLADAATGELPREFLLKVVALSSLQYLVVLIPISLLLAVMLSLGRLYKDQEIAAMTGCGAGPLSLYRPFLTLALLLGVLTAWVSFQAGPWAGRQVEQLVKDAQRLVQYTPFEAGRFREVAGGRAFFYAAEVGEGAGRLESVFVQIAEASGTSVVTARAGSQTIDPSTGERVIVLRDGHRYLGEPGQAAFDIMKFESFITRVAPPEVMHVSAKRKVADSLTLLESQDPRDRAELHWRLAAPISVILLALLAVPLSYVAPREGRHGKLVWGIGVYLIYSNLLALGQTWMAKQVVPSTLGLWWVHALVLMAATWLVARRLGWRRGRAPAVRPTLRRPA